MELVSIDEFAKRVGVSYVSISKAIKQGKIAATRDGPYNKYFIDFDTQGQLWGQNNVHPTKRPKNPSGGRPRVDGKPPKKYVPPEKPAQTEPPKPPPKPPTGQSTLMMNTATLNEIQREREIVKLELDKLKLKEAEGELISAAEVQKSGRALATSIINSLYNIPERCSDEIAGMSDPHAIHKMLVSEIDNAVEMIRKKYVDPS